MKKLPLFILLFLASLQIIAQSTNDDCSNAIVLTPGTIFDDNYYVATNVGASDSNPPSPGCAGFVGGDVWFSVTIPASGNLTIETNNDFGGGSNLTDTGLAVYSGDCTTLSLVSCDDDSSADGSFSLITLTGRLAGEVLYINAWSYFGTTEGTFRISAYDASSVITTPVNDDCFNAIVLTPGGVFDDNDIVTTNLGASNSNPPLPGCAAFSGGDVWYSVTIPASGNLTIETNNDFGGGSNLTDTGLAVYSGYCSNLSLVSCDDDSSTDGNFSLITLTGRTAGEVLYVNAWVFAGGTGGTFKISAYDSSSGGTTPANDDCSNAIVLTPGGVFDDNDIVTTNLGASNSNPPLPGCAAFSGGDVWFSVTIPASGNLTIETKNDFGGGSNLADTGLAVYSGYCSNLSLVSCDDDSSADGNFSLITLTGRTAGEILYVNAWSYLDATEGTFKISSYDASLRSDSFDSASFMVYPNPVKNILNLSNSKNISYVEVYNMLGQKVLVKILNVNNGQVDMTSLDTGNYIVKVTADDVTKTIKVIKQ